MFYKKFSKLLIKIGWFMEKINYNHGFEKKFTNN